MNDSAIILFRGGLYDRLDVWERRVLFEGKLLEKYGISRVKGPFEVSDC